MIITVLILLVVDQVVKCYAIHHQGEEKEILSGIQMTYEESNKGAFGVGQNSKMTYVISTIVVLGVVLKFFFNQMERINMGIVIGMALIIAGGLSNMVDKLFHGIVINCIQLGNLPTINLSFILIVIGWIELAAIFAFHTWKEMRKKDA